MSLEPSNGGRVWVNPPNRYTCLYGKHSRENLKSTDRKVTTLFGRPAVLWLCNNFQYGTKRYGWRFFRSRVGKIYGTSPNVLISALKRWSRGS